jgi:hypothetical protein
MAEKRPKSILSSLKTMLHREPEKARGAAPKKASGSARKKPVAPPPEKSAAPAHNPQEPAPAPSEGAAAESKPDKKKTPNQPWYRHRQRW